MLLWLDCLEVAVLSNDRLSEAFVEALGLPAGYDVTGLEYRSIEQWDSLAHLALVTTIETTFDVMLDVDDVLGLRSYSAGLDILKRHGVTVDG
jgi:acyl carrier protein